MANKRFDWQEAKTLYISGLSTLKVAAQLGVSVSAITYCLSKLGVPKRRVDQREYPHKFDWVKAISLYKSGLSCNKTAAEFGVAPATVYYYLKKKGIEIRGHKKSFRVIRGLQHHAANRDSELNNPEVLKSLYWDQGLSINTIAQRFNISRDTVSRRFQWFGISKRTLAEWYRFFDARDRLKFTTKGLKFHKKFRRVNPEGYVEIKKPEHHRAKCNGWVMEHIVVWEESHNTKLPEGWIIHHLNGIKDDNRPENLEALPANKHKTTTLIDILRERILKLEGRIKELEVTNVR
jgi:AraC-like DNA-binding protein